MAARKKSVKKSGKKAVHPLDHDGDGRKGGSLPKRARVTDLREAVEEARVEVAEERGIPVPRYNPEGVLLNPEDFNVSPEGLLRAK